MSTQVEIDIYRPLMTKKGHHVTEVKFVDWPPYGLVITGVLDGEDYEWWPSGRFMSNSNCIDNDLVYVDELTQAFTSKLGIDSVICWSSMDPYELAVEARCNLALGRVLASLDPAQAMRRTDLAHQQAVHLGVICPSGKYDPGPLLSGSLVLIDSFKQGLKMRDEEERHQELHMNQPCFSFTGEWLTDDGRIERRVCVVQDDAGYWGYIQSSCQGGEPTGGIVTEAFPTEDEALEAAYDVFCDPETT